MRRPRSAVSTMAGMTRLRIHTLASTQNFLVRPLVRRDPPSGTGATPASFDMMVVVLLLIFTIPLVCWALLAYSAMSGDRVGAVLTCCVLAEIAAAKQWFLGTARATLINGLERQHGWRFSDDQACRPGGGWALDREQVCISVDDLTEAPLVVVDVETYYGA